MIHYLRTATSAGIFIFALLLAMPGTVTAEFIGNLVTVQAVSSEGTGTWQIPVPQNPPDRIDYRHPVPVELRDAENTLIGTIDNVAVQLDGDPVASVSFVATAGAFPTTFTVSSAVVSFPAILNPTGNADANVTLIDSSTNGATLTPVAPNTGVFLPTYNGSTLFFPLVGPQTISMGGTVTGMESTGNQLIAGPVSSIQARFAFTLSPMDVANGSGRFEVIPEPATFALTAVAGVIGIAMLRRARRTTG